MNNTEFIKYPHLERFGNKEVEGIEAGLTYVFPKIDGTNASMWFEETRGCRYGSRNRQLSLDKDNAEFMRVMDTMQYGLNYRYLLRKYPHWRLYGEWLVPHSIKGYREDAWRKFYVFDVMDMTTEKFLPYEDYQRILLDHNVDFVPCIAKLNQGDLTKYMELAKKCRFILKDDAPFGEGVVIKNYDYTNVFHRTTWAKVVLQEFKEENAKQFGASILDGKGNEELFAEAVITAALVDKEYSKIANETGWTSKDIPRLIETIYRCAIVEELYDYSKKKLKGSIDLKVVKHFTTAMIKKHKPGLF